MLRRLRRNQNYLIMIGSGVIMIGLWSVIKTICFLLLGSGTAKAYFVEMAQAGVSGRGSILIMLLIVSVDLAVRFFVGLNAIREGYGERRGVLYVVLAVVLSLLSLATLVSSFTSHFQSYNSPLDAGVGLLLELTSLVTLLELVNSVCKVRWLSHQLELME